MKMIGEWFVEVTERTAAAVVGSATITYMHMISITNECNVSTVLVRKTTTTRFFFLPSQLLERGERLFLGGRQSGERNS